MTRAEDAGFADFARALSTRTGVALDAYKPRCLARRIAVRMRACAVHTWDDYLAVLDGTPAELERWFGELPIGLHAEHGFWSRLSPRSEWEPLRPISTDWKERVRPILEQYTARTPGSFV